MRQTFIKIIRSPWALLLPLPFWAVVVGLLYWHNQQILDEAGYEMARQRGEVAFTLIQTMRHWNTEHGGVYAPLTEDTPENPYLDVPEKTITSPSGIQLTSLNPAYMTRQLSELMQGSELEINLTSRRLMNPNNQPDVWEAKVLNYLEETGASEYVETQGEQLRYMAPLYMEPGCLACHAHMGYEVGDLRGGLSVSFPKTYIQRMTHELHRESRSTHLLAFLLLSATGSLAIYGLRRLLTSLNLERSQREAIIHERTASLHEEILRSRESQQKLNYLAHHDELTGAKNRRWILRQLDNLLEAGDLEPLNLAVIMLDIDHFKKINDTYGHDAGDQVLKNFVRTLQQELRETDQLGRYGGEEFLVLLPHTSQEAAWKVAERLRLAVEASLTSYQTHQLKITTSLGISLQPQQPVDSEQLINRADEALYQAKKSGRNRTVIWGT
ncbi:diguanylate cyclase (GGDEF) domain-containing protein [Marinospirillum celere]|uniref:diguanylate cyclase n=1 Tax=Marinospirillum celere TaxID=1122252 RepID=A0A1I1H9H8_9GAMM|nr:diguanylate cyclase [Marinospirillum celere]SFC20416.1 diguanylate cyclase (GGDEF) domain-containing protein [Marinospirillum celere]